jgi:hypothetical protein
VVGAGTTLRTAEGGRRTLTDAHPSFVNSFYVDDL